MEQERSRRRASGPSGAARQASETRSYCDDPVSAKDTRGADRRARDAQPCSEGQQASSRGGPCVPSFLASADDEGTDSDRIVGQIHSRSPQLFPTASALCC
jgi:hypothetical protein